MKNEVAFVYFLVGVFFVGLLFTPSNPTVSPHILLTADIVDAGIAVLAFVAAWFCRRAS